jgi:cytochrome c5
MHRYHRRSISALVLLIAIALPMQGTFADAIPASDAVPVSSLKNGRDVYAAVCSSCHDAGIAGAPKIRDKTAWSARLAEGMGLLYLQSLKGYTGKSGVMPARGGRADLPTELVKQAVDYMVSVSN